MATKRASKIWITWNKDGSVRVKANKYDEVVKDFCKTYDGKWDGEAWTVGAKYAETCVAKIKLNCEDWRWDGELFEEHECDGIEEESDESVTASEIIYNGEHVFDIDSRHYYRIGDAWASCDHGGLNESFEDKDEMEYLERKVTCA